MNFFSSLQVALIVFLPYVWGSVTTDTLIEACLTKYAPKSIIGPVPSTTTTVTVDQLATCQSTNVPTTTIHANPTTVTSESTSLITVTKTLANSMVDTFTSTTTVVSTVDVTITITTSLAPVATVSVTITPTITIATSPGFIYASDSPALKKRALDAAEDYSPLGARHLIPRPEKFPAVRRAEAHTTTSSSEKCYPTAVTCGILIDIISTTTKVITGPTSTITATSTATKASVVISTLTSTYLPADASTTLSVTTTLQVTSSLTSTLTQGSAGTVTVTVSLAAATYYAACSDQNLLTYDPDYQAYATPGDTGVSTNYYGVPDNYIVLNTASAYDCCVACQQNPDCGGAYYEDGPGTCTIDEPSGSCAPDYFGIQYGAYDSSYQGITLIDGNCGVIYST